MKYVWSTATHVGHVRANNEDAVAPTDDGAGPGPMLLAVADGMGGHAGGEVASRIAIETSFRVGDATPADRARRANEAVLEAASEDDELIGMGTTLTLVQLEETGLARFAHIGDSRAYLFRGGELRQVTQDHTVAAEMVRQGQLTPAQAEVHPRRHMLSRVIGMNQIAVDEFEETLTDGDRILLCSDGLTNMLDDDGISMILRTAPSPSDAAWSLIEAANRAGGHDNTTVAVVDVIGTPDVEER